jgi:hypothetical protein
MKGEFKTLIIVIRLFWDLIKKIMDILLKSYNLCDDMGFYKLVIYFHFLFQIPFLDYLLDYQQRNQ